MFKNKEKKIKVALGMSGGVDSSVAAYLLKEQGYEVVGVFMQCWDEKADGCVADDDRTDAVTVASKLGIKFKSLNFVKEYKAKVIEYFYNEYKAGRTPNPDVMCNKEIKFGMFMEWAEKNGFDYVATGHYARVEESNGEFKLLKGIDDSKDQSYFLYLLGQVQLAKTLFPLGGMKKSEIRELAHKIGLHNYDKKDSVGICFIGEVDIKEFLKKEINPKKGNVVTVEGEIIGDHDGVWYYTIGQRHGFRVNKYFGLPLYVIDKNVEKNEIIVGYVKDVVKDTFNVQNAHWISGNAPKMPINLDIRIRHLGEIHAANVKFISKGVAEKDSYLEVKLQDEIFGVAPGQSCVFYLGDEVLGGGIIV